MLLGMWEAEFPKDVNRVRSEAGSRFGRIVDDAATAAAKHFLEARAKSEGVMESFDIAWKLVTIQYLRPKRNGSH
jgi:hypothetical protein